MQNKMACTNGLSVSIQQPNNACHKSQQSTKLSSRLLRQKLLSFIRLLQLWNQRRRQRRDLYSLSDTMLKDIGVSRLDALQEADKPFWRP